MRYLYAYQNIAIPANVITVVCSIEAWNDGSVQVVLMLTWIKLFTTSLLILYIHLFRSSLVFFFMNLGFGRIRFYSIMLIMDLLVFLIVMAGIKIIA